MRGQYCFVVQELPSRVLSVLNIIALFKTHFEELLKEMFMEIWVNDCFHDTKDTVTKFQSCKFRITQKLQTDGVALHNCGLYVKQTRTCNSLTVQSSCRLTAKAAPQNEFTNVSLAGILSGPKSNSEEKSIKGEISGYHSGVDKD